MVISGWLIFAAILVLVLALFAGLVWLFVLLSRGRMQPRQEVQMPPAKGPSGKDKRPRR